MPGEGAEFLPRHYVGKFDLHQRAYAMFNFSKLVEPRYLYFYLISVKNYFADNAVGATVKSLRRRHFTDLNIPLPQLEKQREIVQKLDNAFAEIDSLEKNLQLKEERTNQLLQSMLNATFSNYGYSKNDVFISTIGQLCEIGDGNHSSKYPTKDEMISSGVPFIRAKNLIHDDVDATDLIYISKHKHEDLLKGHIKKGDILLTNRGEIGKLAIVPAKFDGSNLNAQIAWLRCSDKIINRYLFLYLKSDLAKKLFISGTRGSALQQLTIGKLKSIEVPVLGLKNQQMIIDKLDKVFAEIDKLKAQTSIQKKSVNALRQSILSRAFNLDDKVA
jgi:type I restriction enzyme S subunit